MTRDDSDAECINCHKRAPAAGMTWPVGWGCLWGQLACCSRVCANAFAVSNGSDPIVDEDYDEG